MINRYTEHSANERTYLAWVRTAISVMAFGFLVEKFDLFLAYSARAAAVPQSVGGGLVGNVVGLLLIVQGGVMLVAATLRFRQTGWDIDDPVTRQTRGTRLDQLLVGILLLLATTLFAYIVLTVIRQGR